MPILQKWPPHGVVDAHFAKMTSNFGFLAAVSFMIPLFWTLGNSWAYNDPQSSSIASPCQEGQNERTFPIFAFSSAFFLFILIFSWFFPSFSRFLTFFFCCQGGYSAPLAPLLAMPLPQSLYFESQFSISGCFRGHPRPLKPSTTLGFRLGGREGILLL